MRYIRLFRASLASPFSLPFGANGVSIQTRSTQSVIFEEYTLIVRFTKQAFERLDALAQSENKDIADLLNEGLERVLAARN